MSTSAGSAVANSTARYTPFGDWRTEPTATLTDRGYTGHLHNNLGSGSDDLGLIYMNARYYLPSSGRFISPDTIVPNPTNPQTYNRYSYVYNNPLNLIDPSGHIACEAMPVECQIDSQGNENWTIGNIITKPNAYLTLLLRRINYYVALDQTMQHTMNDPGAGIQETSDINIGTMAVEDTEDIIAASGGNADLALFLYDNIGASADLMALGFIQKFGGPEVGCSGGVCYRFGGRTATNLTPRPQDMDSGLSLSTTPGKGWQINASPQQLEEMGFIISPDPTDIDPGHFLIRPGAAFEQQGWTMESWVASRSIMNPNDPSTWHPLTKLLYDLATSYP